METTNNWYHTWAASNAWAKRFVIVYSNVCKLCNLKSDVQSAVAEWNVIGHVIGGWQRPVDQLHCVGFGMPLTTSGGACGNGKMLLWIVW